MTETKNSPVDKKKKKEPSMDPFIADIERNREDRGMMASLRRGMGHKAGEVAETSRIIQCWLHWDDPHVQEKEQAYYLIAPLFGLYHDEISEEGNIGKHMRDLCEPGEEPPTSIERRFMSILACDGEEFGDQLRQIIMLLKSKHIEVHWQQLLFDVRRWQRHEDSRNQVRREWSRSFWRSERKPSTATPQINQTSNV